MKTNFTLNRRQFLKSSLGAGTSLVLGVYLGGCQSSPSQVPESASPTISKTFSPNVFLRIDSDNTVTIIVPRSEMGQGVRTSLPMIVAEELDADWSTLRVEQAIASEVYGPQFTGGSTSISLFWQPLREAGAAARAMLIAAAAQTWQVEAKTCTTGNSVVIHEASGRSLTYGELAATAARLPVPDPATLTLKKPSEFRLVGTAMGHVDSPHIVDGSAVFGLDVKVPGMLYAAIARCPVFGGKLVSFDPTETRAVEGVRDVVEIENAVAVVAENSWAALQGQQALKVTWEEGPHASTNSDNIRQGVLAQLPSAVVIGDEPSQVQTTGKLEALYEVPYLAHAPMEPMNCVADVHPDRIEVWAPTQNPLEAQRVSQSPTGGRWMRYVRRLLTGVPLEAIKVNVPLIGGGFGRRLQVDYVSEAVQVSQVVGAPVQVIWSREDDLQHDYYHPISYHYVTAELAATAKMEQKRFNGPEGISQGPWRAVENITDAFVQECFVDELAAALGRDPYELRLERIHNPRRKAVLELAAEKGNWGSPLSEGWGRGIASYSTYGVTHVAEVVELSVVEDGQVRVQRVVCAIDCGLVINPDTVKAQVEGGIVFALSAALKSKITLANGRVTQSNFHDYPILRFNEMPLVEVYIVPSEEPPAGVGEGSGPCLIPAVANAIYAATGKRIRHIPILAEDLL